MTDAFPSEVPVAVLGAGRWGRTLVSAIRATPGINLAAMISSKPDAPDFLDPGVPVFADWRDAMDAAPVDGVIVAVPPKQQPEIAVALIENRIPVMLEKPLAMSAAEAERILTAARQHGFTGLVDHLHVYAPAFVALAGMLKTAKGIQRIRAAAGADGPYRAGWSALWDWGAHDIAMVLTVSTGRPVETTATLEKCVRDGHRQYENYRIDISFDDGSTADLLVGNAFGRKTREFCVEAGGKNLCYRESAAGEASLAVDDTPVAGADKEPDLRPLNAALAEFARRIRGGGGIGDVELGTQVVHLLEAAERSVVSGRPVQFSGAGTA